MCREGRDGNIQDFDLLGMDMQDGLKAVQEVARQEIPVGSGTRLADVCTCILESLKEIMQLALKGNAEKTERKLEYALGAIMKETARQIYYWGIPDERDDKNV